MNLESSLLAVLASLVGALIWVVKHLMARSDRILESRDMQIGSALDKLSAAVDAFGRVEQREDEVHDALLVRMEALSGEHGSIISRLEAVTVVQKQLVQLNESILSGISERISRSQ